MDETTALCICLRARSRTTLMQSRWSRSMSLQNFSSRTSSQKCSARIKLHHIGGSWSVQNVQEVRSTKTLLGRQHGTQVSLGTSVGYWSLRIPTLTRTSWEANIWWIKERTMRQYSILTSSCQGLRRKKAQAVLDRYLTWLSVCRHLAKQCLCQATGGTQFWTWTWLSQ